MLYCRLYSFNIYFILYLSIFPFHHINIVVSIIDIIIIIERSGVQVKKVQHFFESIFCKKIDDYHMAMNKKF